MTPDEARARAERAVCAMVSSSATFAAMAWTTQRLGLVLGVGCYAPVGGRRAERGERGRGERVRGRGGERGDEGARGER